MKKIVIFLVLLAISCSKEDTPPQEESLKKADLIGTWDLSWATMNGATIELSECDRKKKLDITTSNITYSGWYQTSASGNCAEYTEIHTYTIEGKQIKIPNSSLGANYKAIVNAEGKIELTTNSGNGNAMIQAFTKR